MFKFRVAHTHEYGVTIHNFESEYNLHQVYNSLYDGEGEELAVEFANEVLGIDYAGDGHEQLDFDDANMDVVTIDVIDPKFLEYLK